METERRTTTIRDPKEKTVAETVVKSSLDGTNMWIQLCHQIIR